MDLAKRTLIFCGAILALVITAPAFAQYTGQEGYYLRLREAECGAYDNNHRWHDTTWWHRHYIECFYATRQERVVMDAVWLTPEGDYNIGSWHNAYRLHNNGPNFFYADRPHGISWEPNWRDQDDAYDARHDWQYGQWWHKQPNWVSIGHPNSSARPNWANHFEELDRALTRAANDGNQRTSGQPDSTQQNRVNQQNPTQKAAAICVFLLVLRSGLSP